MTDTKLGEAYIELGVREGGLDRGLNNGVRKVNAASKRMQSSLASIGVVAANSGRALAKYGTLVGALGTGAFALAIRGAFELAESLADQANKANVAVDFLQELQFAVNQNGAEFRDATDALVRLNRRMGLFTQSGAGPAAAGMKALSQEFRDALVATESNEERFKILTRALQDFESDAEKAAVASAFFGDDAGPRLVPLLKQGEAGIEAWSAKAREMGFVIENSLINNAASVNAQMRALSQVIGRQATVAVLQLTPQIQSLSEAFADALPGILDAVSGLAQFFGMIDAPRLQRIAELRAEVADLDAQLSQVSIGGTGNFSLGDGTGVVEGILDDRRAALDELRRLTEEQAIKEQQLARAAEQQQARLEEISSGVTGINPNAAGGAQTSPENNFIDQAEAAVRLAEAQRELAAATDDTTKANERYGQSRDVVDEATKRGLAVQAAFEDGISDLARNMLDAARNGGSFRESLLGVVSAMAEAIFEAIVLQPLISGISSALGGVFGGGGAIPAPAGLAAPRALGGPVQPGREYYVGEHGPERFVPNVPGTILPNGAGEGGGVVQHIHIAAGVGPTVRAEVRRMMPELQKSAVAAVGEVRRRGSKAAG